MQAAQLQQKVLALESQLASKDAELRELRELTQDMSQDMQAAKIIDLSKKVHPMHPHVQTAVLCLQITPTRRYPCVESSLKSCSGARKAACGKDGGGPGYEWQHGCVRRSSCPSRGQCLTIGARPLRVQPRGTNTQCMCFMAQGQSAGCCGTELPATCLLSPSAPYLSCPPPSHPARPSRPSPAAWWRKQRRQLKLPSGRLHSGKKSSRKPPTKSHSLSKR